MISGCLRATVYIPCEISLLHHVSLSADTREINTVNFAMYSVTVCTHTRTHRHTGTHTHVHTRTHTYTHTQTHHAHIHKHTHIHTEHNRQTDAHTQTTQHTQSQYIIIVYHSLQREWHDNRQGVNTKNVTNDQ